MASMLEPTGFSALAAQASREIVTQESPMRVREKDTTLKIGVPKERGFQENRVGLTPQAVAQLTARGHEVVVESKAGADSFFTDHEYGEAGANVVYQPQAVYAGSDVVVRVGPVPMDELEFLKPGHFVFSAIHPSTLTEEYFKALMAKRVAGLAFEFLKDAAGSYPIVRSMSEIAGCTAILIAAEYLSNLFHGSGMLLGGVTGIPPSKIVIIGAGTVGEFAARTALGLGAEVRIFDNSLYRLRRIQNNLGSRVYAAVSQPDVLARELQTAEVAIGAMRAVNGRTPMLVSEETVSHMRAGAVIVDVSIDQGGVFETSQVTTHNRPTFKKHGIVHYCVPNIPSRVAKTASISLSNILVPILLHAGEHGGLGEYLWHDQGLRCAAYLYNGSVTSKHLADRFNLSFTNLDLLASAMI